MQSGSLLRTVARSAFGNGIVGVGALQCCRGRSVRAAGRVGISFSLTAGAALGVIFRIRSLETECALLRRLRQDQDDHERRGASGSDHVSVSVMHQSIVDATQVAQRQARALAIEVASATLVAAHHAKIQSEAGMANVLRESADRNEAARLALADSKSLAQTLAVVTMAATARAKEDATALAVKVALESASATASAQVKADSATQAALTESASQAHMVEAATVALTLLAKQKAADLASTLKAASNSATILAQAKADAAAADAKRISVSQAETVAAANLAANLLTQQETTALAVEVAANSLTATVLALAKSDAAVEQATRASVAQAHAVAAETLALSMIARQEAISLARQVAVASASAIAIAQAKCESDAASARRESDSLEQELASANETNALLEVALLRSEKKTLESNSSQLRAMMGNMAHDLKTPLQAIIMGIEMCRLKYALSLNMASRSGSNSGSISPSGTDASSATRAPTCDLLDNMTASCQFMEMAIHRSLDFTKSSNNIALLPALETVDVEATVRTQLHMTRSLRHNVSIELGALPGGMCSMMITDRHWLAENVLCLLSNAVKYSDGGLIEIEFQVIRSSEGVAANRNAGASIVDSTRPLALRITISDSGIGVPESVRATLFQPFQQAQKMAGGTGLGLFSLRKRVEALGGCCGVESRDDGARGSAFWFEFPYRPDFAAMKAAARSLRQCRTSTSPNLSETDSDIDHEAQYGAESFTRRPCPIAALEAFSANVVAAGASAQSDLAATDVFLSPAQGLLEFDRGWAVRRDMECNADAGAGGMCHEELQSLRLRVILVDDAPFIIAMTKRVLEKKGHIVESAPNGSLGLAMLMETHDTGSDFDLVLCDFQMPVMDGFEAVRRYRAFERAKLVRPDAAASTRSRPNMAIVGMSASSDLASMAQAREVGMNAVMTKPFSIANLQGMLNLFLQ